MKLLIGIIFAFLCTQTLAQDGFREEIHEIFTRFDAFYDATNEAMKNYRLSHVDEMVPIFNGCMQIFGEDITYVRESRAYVNRVVSDVLQILGGQPNACLNSVMSRIIANSQEMGEHFNFCAGRANRTMTYAITDIYYPTFQHIQNTVSPVPLATFDALARGNLFADRTEIVDYLQSQYDVMTMQWLGAVSQLFRWETARFAVEGSFYVEEMIDCAQEAIDNYSNTNSVLMFEAWDQCRP